MSTLFTVATKAYDNFVNPQGEDKYNSTGRKVAETITESAVDIACLLYTSDAADD